MSVPHSPSPSLISLSHSLSFFMLENGVCMDSLCEPLYNFSCFYFYMYRRHDGHGLSTPLFSHSPSPSLISMCLSTFLKKGALCHIHLSLSPSLCVCLCVCVCWCRHRNGGHYCRGDSSVPTAIYCFPLLPSSYIHSIFRFRVSWEANLLL